MELSDLITKETRNDERMSLETQKLILLQEFETWRLLYLLNESGCCFKSEKNQKEIKQNENFNQFSSKYGLLSRFNNFVKNNQEFKKAFTVINWLESVEEYRTKYDPKKNFLLNKPQLNWAETFKSINKNDKIIKMIDFDAPNREKNVAELSKADQIDEEKMLVSIYR